MVAEPSTTARVRPSERGCPTLGSPNVGLECVETPFGENGCDNAAGAVEANGGTVVGRRPHPIDASDFTSSIVDMHAAGAVAMALFTSPSPHITFMKQLEENEGLAIQVVGGASSELIYGAHSPAQREAHRSRSCPEP